MAEPALQYDEFEDIEPIEIPAGGIATFLTAKEGMFADDDNIPQGGIAQVKAVADQLAEFGRYEDQYMVHAAHGETVIPMEVFRKNPILKENIYRQMRDMGLEPERYVVGSDFNSINPVTGQPEFFLKKLFKGIKKVFKVVAPIVLQAVLTPIVGPIYAGAITGGITSLAQGGSFKDALKAAAIGGTIGGITKGLKGAAGAASKGGNVLTGAKEGFMAARGVDAFQAGAAGAINQSQAELAKQSIQQFGTGATEEAAKKAAEEAGKFTYMPDGSAVPVTGGDTLVSSGAPSLVGTTGTTLQGAAGGDYIPSFSTLDATQPNLADQYRAYTLGPQTIGSEAEALSNMGFSAEDIALRQGQAGVVTPTAAVTDAATTSVQAPGVMESLGKFVPGKNFDLKEGLMDLFLPGMDVNAQAAAIAEKATEEQLGGLTREAFAKKLAAEAFSGIGGFTRKFGPGIAGIMAFDALNREQPQDFNVDEQVTGFDLYEQDPFRYSVGRFQPRPTNFKIKTLTQEDYGLPSTGSVYLPYAAEGGAIDENIFPRMNGPIKGPGTGTSDDIPAMLSDGEFVMTAKAVRGAGKGSRQEGMRNMYQMMSNFEAMA